MCDFVTASRRSVPSDPRVSLYLLGLYHCVVDTKAFYYLSLTQSGNKFFDCQTLLSWVYETTFLLRHLTHSFFILNFALSLGISYTETFW